MAANSKIEWTDHTFNPWIGCTKVGPGCDNCYAAAREDTRLHRVEWGAGKERRHTSAANWREPLKWNAREFVQCVACGWRGPLDEFKRQEAGGLDSCCPSCAEPRYIAARQRVFCASLADVFDNEVVDEWRADLFRLIAATPNLDWLLLTKRIGNAEKMIRSALDTLIRESGPAQPEPPYWPWLNVWLGATIVTQEEADRDIGKLLATPAAVRFLSMEPLLGLVDLPGLFYYGTQRSGGVVPLRDKGFPQIDWVIAGGESGHGARTMHPDWPRGLRDQCAAAGVPFLFKQWGDWLPVHVNDEDKVFAADGTSRPIIGGANGIPMTAAHGHEFAHVGKREAGRLLDGRTHDGVPAPAVLA